MKACFYLFCHMGEISVHYTVVIMPLGIFFLLIACAASTVAVSALPSAIAHLD